MSLDLYRVLGVSPGVSALELHAHYKALALQWHPDRFPENQPRAKQAAEIKFSEITAAYSILKDPKRRREYDARLKMEDRNCLACNGSGHKKKARGFTSVQVQRCPVCQGTGRRSNGS